MPLATLAKLHLIAVLSAVSIKPNPSALPGTSALEKLLNGLAALALLGCVATIVIGAAQLGFGNRAGNYSQAADGKSKILYGIAGAFAVGAVSALVNFFYNAGSAVHP